jgi:predicted ArsR family transcriptional regulator
MRIVKLLVGRAPQTVAQLIRAAGVTRTAVSEQLNELVAAGFAARSYERLPGRGRPRHLYSATDAALLLLFASNQHLLVPAMLRAVVDVGGDVLKQRVLKRVGCEMAEHYRERIDGKTPAERLRQMTELLCEEGDLVDVSEDSGGRLLINRRSCGFFSMFEESRSVCIVDEEMIGRVVGEPVRRTACRHDGDPCCQFVLASSNGH